MRFPRMTTRRWMVVVAVLGVALGVGAHAIRLRAVAYQHRVRADQCARSQTEWVVAAELFEFMASDERRSAEDLESLATPQARFIKDDRRRLDLANYHRGISEHWEIRSTEALSTSSRYGDLEQKHRRAMRSPWIAVDPDPPDPPSPPRVLLNPMP